MVTKREKGQAAVILAVALVALLAFAALAIDAGAAYAARREAQNAADAAAMAGARQVVLECGNQYPNAAAILDQVNKLSKANTDGTIAASYLIEGGVPVAIDPIGSVPCGCGNGRAIGVQAVVEKDSPSFFSVVFGGSGTVKAEARARFGSVTNVGTGVYPLTRIMPNPDVPGSGITFGQRVKIRTTDDFGECRAGGGGGVGQCNDVPGNFGWLSWDGQNNVPALAESLEPPGNSHIRYYNPGTPDNNWTPNYNDHVLAVGKWVQGAPGNKNSAQVRGQLNDHFLPTANPRHVMIIPLYDATREGKQGGGQGANANFRVGGFAAFYLECYKFAGGGSSGGDCIFEPDTPNEKYAEATFIKWVTDGDWDPTVSCEAEGGVYSIKLVP